MKNAEFPVPKSCAIVATWQKLDFTGTSFIALILKRVDFGAGFSCSFLLQQTMVTVTGDDWVVNSCSKKGPFAKICEVLNCQHIAIPFIF